MRKILFLMLLPMVAFAKTLPRVIDIDNENAVITCQVKQLCDIAFLADDQIETMIFNNPEPWKDRASDDKYRYKDTQNRWHVLLQPSILDSYNTTIIIANTRRYTFKLRAVKEFSNPNYEFFQNVKQSALVVDEGVKLNFSKLNYSYKVLGATSSIINPESVFNDGDKMYIKMSEAINHGELPTIYSLDGSGTLLQLTDVRYRKPFFVIDSLYPALAVISGSVSDVDNQLRVDIRYAGKKETFWTWLMQQYPDR